MKTVQSIAALSLVLVSGVAHADFSGKWKGMSTMTDMEAPCATEMVVHQSATTFEIDSYSVKCEGLNIDSDPQKFAIENGALVMNREVVGKISKDSWSFSQKDGEGAVGVQSGKILPNGDMKVTLTLEMNGELLMGIDGDLKK